MDVILQLYRIWSYTKQNFVTPKSYIWNEFCEEFLFFLFGIFLLLINSHCVLRWKQSGKKHGDSLAWQLYFWERVTMRITLDERVLWIRKREKKQKYLNWCCNHLNVDGMVTHTFASASKKDNKVDEKEMELGRERKKWQQTKVNIVKYWKPHWTRDLNRKL